MYKEKKSEINYYKNKFNKLVYTYKIILFNEKIVLFFIS